VEAPEKLGKFKANRVEGNTMKLQGTGTLLVSPEQNNWTLFWEV
jgi:hypothetical protein